MNALLHRGAGQANIGSFADKRAPHPGPAQWRTNWSNMSRAGLVVADVAALLFSFAIVAMLGQLLFGGGHRPLGLANFVAVVSWFLFCWTSGRYSFGQHAPEELRECFRASLIAGLIHLATLLANDMPDVSQLFSLLTWGLVFPLSYLTREIWRSGRKKAGRYGVPVAVVGNGLAARRAIRELQAQATLGYVPVALFSTDKAAPGELRQVLGVPMVGRSEEAVTYNFPFVIQHALLAVGAGWEDERNHPLTAQLSRRFQHLQIFTNVVGTGHWLSQVRAFGPYVAIHTSNARLTSHQRLLKRSLDVAISLPALVVSAPIVLIAAIAIKVADGGPVFYSQTREGRGGKPIRIWKLRSMVQGAEGKLAKHLAEDQAARIEYERTMKLRDDPRILPVVGKIIRKASIDELPQMWSILKGDMSLVGPRIMPSREVDLYSQQGQDIRRDMPPGLTGFWQVEHRNDSDFQIREVADSFYVANWSPWLDLWIMLRTVRVVLAGVGAF